MAVSVASEPPLRNLTAPHSGGCHLQQFLGEGEGLRGRAVEGRGEVEPLHLRGHGLDYCLVSIPQAVDEHPGESVDVLLALHVRDADAVALGEEEWVAGELPHLHEVQEEMLQILHQPALHI